MKDLREIQSKEEFFIFFGIRKKIYTYLLYGDKRGLGAHYSTFEIPKKNGDFRTIEAPSNKLVRQQRKITKKLYEHQDLIFREEKITQKISHGFEKNKSILTNAKIHKNKRYVLNIDLKDFFGSFHFGRVRGYFRKNKYFSLPDSVAIIIAQLTCFNGKLPQGAPTSPIIANLISRDLDNRLLQLTRKYKVDYTRYADDLTFSTNRKEFFDECEDFIVKVKAIVEKSGFRVNEEKVRLRDKTQRLTVTGLVVNKKVNVDRKFIRETRVMADKLYKNGTFHIDGFKGTIEQLNGRFAFINQVDKWNNKYICEKRKIKKDEQYRQFLFYKHFYMNSKPLIITEGKTDSRYIKAALKNMCKEYKGLIKKDDNENFDFKVAFLNRTPTLKYFFGIPKEGPGVMKKIYEFYIDRNNTQGIPNYFKKFLSCEKVPINPVFFVFDNEEKGPLYEIFKNIAGESGDLLKEVKEKGYLKIMSNLYVITYKSIEDSKKNVEIEDLFDESILGKKIKGLEFSCNRKEKGMKDEFSRYVISHYQSINFEGFRELLDTFISCIQEYKNGC